MNVYGGASVPASRSQENRMRTITILSLTVITALAALANKATINPDGVLEIDGKKIFVIGFTAAPPADGKTPTGKDAFAELADAGATFVRFGPEQPWSDARFEQEQKFEDAAAHYGLHCWLNLREASSIKPGEIGRASCRERV